MSARRSVWSVARKILFGLGRLVFYALVEGPVFGILAASLNALMIVTMGDFVEFFYESEKFWPSFATFCFFPAMAYFFPISGYPIFVIVAWQSSAEGKRSLRKTTFARCLAFLGWLAVFYILVLMSFWDLLLNPPLEQIAVWTMFAVSGGAATATSEFLWYRLQTRMAALCAARRVEIA